MPREDIVVPPLPPRTGRPPGASSIYDDDEFPRAARQLCRLGATDADLADWFAVDINTIKNWSCFFARFGAALRVGKGEADDRVERSLWMRAVGYTHDAVKIFLIDETTATIRDGAVVEQVTVKKPLVVPYREHVPPEVTACRLWLINRKPEDWRDTQERKFTGSVSVTVSREEAQY
jgi:hypothetical protein